MDTYMIVAGAIACLGLSAAGSAFGTGFAASAAVGAWKKCYAANKPAPFLLLSFVGAPITQTLYGMILMFIMLGKVGNVSAGAGLPVLLAGIFAGVVTSLVCVLALSFLFRLDHATYATLLPKSITSAIGMDVSAMLGGHVSITIAIIIITGIFGNLIAETVCRVFKITEPIAKGVAIGTSSHALGTAKAIEMGEIEGAMSGLSIVVAGILTVLLSPLFGGLI